jgi:hypothetical protein
MKNKPHKCAWCKSDPHLCDDPADATGLFKGTYFNECTQRIMPIKAWLCDMHSDETETGRFHLTGG